jgi:hypothetical protein
MRYRYALDRIKSAVPEAHGRVMEMGARQALRHRQLEAARSNPKGWPWQRRRVWRRNSGGYTDGTLNATQDSRVVTLSGGTFPDPCAGWILDLTGADEESYRIESRTGTTAVKIDRPYEGDTGADKEYNAYDPFVQAPSDLYAWASLVLEADGERLGEWTMGHVRGRWPQPLALGTGYVATVSEPSDAAAYETGTVTVAKGSAAVTGSGMTLPEWVHGHHFQIAGENILYRIKTGDSATSAITLDRPYGGGNGGAGKSYQIDPPGAIQVEVMWPRLKQYGLKIDYFALPQELANDTDLMPGDEAYAAAIVDLATADMIVSTIDSSLMSEGMIQERMLKARQIEARGQAALNRMIGSNAPEPEEDAVLEDVRWAGGPSPPWQWTYRE